MGVCFVSIKDLCDGEEHMVDVELKSIDSGSIQLVVQATPFGGTTVYTVQEYIWTYAFV